MKQMNMTLSFLKFFGFGSESESKSGRLWFNQTLSGVTVTQETALGLSAYYSAIRNISEDIGKIPTYVFKGLKDGGKERLFKNSVDFIFNNRPNDEMTPMTFKEVMTANCLGWGNAYAEIIKNRFGDALELRIIHPSRVTVKRNTQNKIEYHVFSGAELEGVKITQTGTFNILQAENIFHLKTLGKNGLVGESIINHAREILGGGLASQEFGHAYFGNGASAGSVLTMPEKLSDKAKENLIESFKEKRQGSKDAHKPIVLEEGMKLEEMKVNPKDSMLIEYKKYTVTEIARLFRIPPHKIGDLERSTFSNIEQQNIDYATDTLLPWIIRWEQEINIKLLKKDENFSKFDLSDLLRGDQKSRGEYYKTMFNLGAMNPNEIRDREDLNPIIGGDEFFIQLNMATTEQVIDNKGAETTNDKSIVEESEDEQMKAFTPIISKIVANVNNKERNANKRGKAINKTEQCLYAYNSLSPVLESFQSIKCEKKALSFNALMSKLSKYYDDAKMHKEINDSDLIEIFKKCCT